MVAYSSYSAIAPSNSPFNALLCQISYQHSAHWSYRSATSNILRLVTSLRSSSSRSCIGYIGGTIIQRLLDHEDRATFDITVLVRNHLKAEKLHQFGITPVIGSLQDTEKLAQLASQADIVIHAVGLSQHVSTALCVDITGLRLG